MEYWGVRKRQQQKESGARIQEPGGAGVSWPMRVFSTERAGGEDLGAPKTSSSQHFSAPDLSRAVDDPPHCISELAGPTTPWTMQPTRMAQIRRGMH
jgi:hypothetical protein